MSCVPLLLLERALTPPAEACPSLEGTHPVHPWSDAPWAEAVSLVLQLQVCVGSRAGSSSHLGREPRLGQSIASSAESSRAGAGHVHDPPLWFFSPRRSEGAACRGGTGCPALQPMVLLHGRPGVCSTMSLMISVQSWPGIHSASAFLTSSISAASQVAITRTRCGWLVHCCRVEKASVFLPSC